MKPQPADLDSANSADREDGSDRNGSVVRGSLVGVPIVVNRYILS